VLAAGYPDLPPLFDASTHGPMPVVEGEAVAEGGVAPAWLLERFDPLVDAGAQAPRLARAPLDLRVNRLRGNRETAEAALPEAVPTPHSPIGLRMPEGFKVEQTEAWEAGLVEVQDEGSQLICLASAARPDMLVAAVAAAAAGKTRALAAEMEGRGRLVACDTDRGRLSRIPARLERAGITIVETRLLDPGKEAAAVADLAGQGRARP